MTLRHRKATPHELLKHGKWSLALAKANRAIFTGSGLIAFLGDRGNGKTQMGVELIRENSRLGKSSTYIRSRDIGMEIRQSYKQGALSTDKSVIDRLSRVKLLVIDELQEQPDTDFEMKNLRLIVDNRYGAMLPTVLIANMTLKVFMDHVGGSIVDRIHEGGLVINFDWPSFRITNGQRTTGKKEPRPG